MVVIRVKCCKINGFEQEFIFGSYVGDEATCRILGNRTPSKNHNHGGVCQLVGKVDFQKKFSVRGTPLTVYGISWHTIFT